MFTSLQTQVRIGPKLVFLLDTGTDALQTVMGLSSQPGFKVATSIPRTIQGQLGRHGRRLVQEIGKRYLQVTMEQNLRLSS